MIQTESGGNFKARNNAVGSSGRAGHFGRVQFGHDRLDDARRAGVIPENMTAEQFLVDPAAQARAEKWHFADINSFIDSKGLDKYIGQKINGVTVTRDGMVAVAHLGGKGGLEQFVKSGGEYNPADDNGTSLQDYLATHGGTSVSPGGNRLSFGSAVTGDVSEGDLPLDLGVPISDGITATTSQYLPLQIAAMPTLTDAINFISDGGETKSSKDSEFDGAMRYIIPVG